MMDDIPCRGLVLNRPQFFADPGFRQWLANGSPKFTWYRGGNVDEWSDVVVLVDPGLTGEGTDADMLAHIWDEIVEACRAHLGDSRDSAAHHMVRLTNLAA